MGARRGVDCRHAMQGSQGVMQVCVSVCVWFNKQAGRSKVHGCWSHPTRVLIGGTTLQSEQVSLSQRESSPLKGFYAFILKMKLSSLLCTFELWQKLRPGSAVFGEDLGGFWLLKNCRALRTSEVPTHQPQREKLQ